MTMADNVVILDFETTGLSPDIGDRAIEIGAVRLNEGKVVDQFQELMNPGFHVDRFIEDYTGITNIMLKGASPCADVMGRFADFLGDSNMVAHNASFDKRFLDSEFSYIKRRYTGEFTCSLLSARRIFLNTPDYKLGTLVKHLKLSKEGTFHRALYDAEMTAKVWLSILELIRKSYGINDIPFALIQKINRTPKKSVAKMLTRMSCSA